MVVYYGFDLNCVDVFTMFFSRCKVSSDILDVCVYVICKSVNKFTASDWNATLSDMYQYVNS